MRFAGGRLPPLQSAIYANVAEILRDAQGGVPYKEQHQTFDPGGAGGFSRGNPKGVLPLYSPLSGIFGYFLVPYQKVTPARQGKVCGIMPQKPKA